jgi:hypothetical protein
MARAVDRLWPDDQACATDATDATGDTGRAAEFTLLDFDPDGEEKVLAAACFSAELRCSEANRRLQRVRLLNGEDRVALLAAYVGERTEPPPSPRPRLRAHLLPLRTGD